MPSSHFLKYFGLVIACFVAVLAFLWSEMPDGKFHIFFLNIGQGDSIFIVTPENHKILIDGGPKNHVLTELNQVMSFFDNTIDMVVLTHPDADHVDGLAEVLKRYEVANVLFTGIENSTPSYQEFLREIHGQNINFIVANSNTDFKFGDVVMDLLYPIQHLEGLRFETPNDSSIVVKLFYKGERILLTGDLEAKGESELIQSGIDLKADLYKAGHHGSKTSSSEAFLNLIRPKYTVIQSGKDNKFGHPHIEILKRLVKNGVQKIFRNDQLGRIEFVF